MKSCSSSVRRVKKLIILHMCRLKGAGGRGGVDREGKEKGEGGEGRRGKEGRGEGG